ncbi:MAG: hypothetical protein HN509_06260 [Halobacteriovoraceae bacterium]|jgi:hypothetical protein|nr:hypothetical protein [Halobacteriovoraceae bacterium]MBT5095325.1 hypothetical protein [Halobacteriovoraceae bacterium]
MRAIIIYSFLILLVSYSPAGQGEIQFDWSSYTRDEINEINQKDQVKRRSADLLYLTKAKKFLINGNLDMSEFYLKLIDEKVSPLAIIKHRYQGIIHFIREDFEKSYQQVSGALFNENVSYVEVCLLRIINLMTKKPDKKLLKELAGCRALTSNYSKNDQMWLETLENVKLKKEWALRGDQIALNRVTFETTEIIKVWIKLGLYLNREDLIIKNLSELPPKIYRSKRVRELLALAFYRKGKKKRALEFIEDVTSPNAENIKGNINLEKKEYELAFGHFKLALKKKQNSINAMERAIPLAWILGQWKDGVILLKRIVRLDLDNKKKIALDTAFRIRLNQFNKAEEQLRLLDLNFRNRGPIELDQMRSYVALRRYDMDGLREFSSRACRRFDALHCWILGQLQIWENIGKTIERDETPFSQKEITVAALKEKSTITPLEERIIVDQRDIEELDSALVKLK